MSRLVKVPVGKEIKPLLGPFLLKGGRTYEMQPSWILPEVYTDGSPIGDSKDAAKVEKEEEVNHAPEEYKPKTKKRVKKTTTEASKAEKTTDEDYDA